MFKIIFITLIQTFFLLTAVSALDHSQKVKSEALKAMQRYDTKTLNLITKNEAKVIKTDAKLQKMIDVYYEEEAKELEVIKEIIAKNQDENESETQHNVDNSTPRESNTTNVSAIVATPKMKEPVEKKVAVGSQPVVNAKSKTVAASPKVAVATKQKSEIVAVKQSKTVPQKKIAKKTEVIEPPKVREAKKSPVKKTVPYVVSDRYLMGKWKQTKKKKKIVLKMMPNNRFVLEEKAKNGVLKLEGSFSHENDNLELAISKIMYNVRSRDASVHRTYKLKNISKTQMVLIDEKGEVVYTFGR